MNRLSHRRGLRRLAVICTFALALSLLVPLALSADTPPPAAGEGSGASTAKSRLHLPSLFGRGKLSDRLGFGATVVSVGHYPEIASLKAGWYVDWTVRENPARPNMMEYVQTVRVHQALTCPIGSANAHDRTQCPYAVPHDYVIMPDLAAIRTSVRANPGSLWLIGNEMDRRDWAGGGQDEILPETYAVAYRDLYYYIKALDPRARVAIGGVIQPTPLRLEYLTKVWDAYEGLFAGTMPVDVWNVHNFILTERLYEYGASIPPGSTATEGVIHRSDWDHINMAIFDQQIRAFRSWMKQRGQQQKPLIVSEYGVLLYTSGLEDPGRVEHFMESTFDYFLNTKDCSIGYQADDCRLVQRWNWYSLDDPGVDFNKYGALFDVSTGQITNTGIRFRNYSLRNLDKLTLY